MYKYAKNLKMEKLTDRQDELDIVASNTVY